MASSLLFFCGGWGDIVINLGCCPIAKTSTLGVTTYYDRPVKAIALQRSDVIVMSVIQITVSHSNSLTRQRFVPAEVSSNVTPVGSTPTARAMSNTEKQQHSGGSCR
ncbi:hypothetical protein MAR_018128 [Mya arenaria]|uniref:Secreted protein n=1 Tax=Mya arenaria TaxID=6604 RepID=A0ABY7EGE6_MYAAR|nr:hypothetical protein MAR_018128 [Mya arenaria]